MIHPYSYLGVTPRNTTLLHQKSLLFGVGLSAISFVSLSLHKRMPLLSLTQFYTLSLRGVARNEAKQSRGWGGFSIYIKLRKPKHPQRTKKTKRSVKTHQLQLSKRYPNQKQRYRKLVKNKQLTKSTIYGRTPLYKLYRTLQTR